MDHEGEPGPPAPTVVAVGASAGGVEALSALVARLPEGFAGALVVVLHISSGGSSVLPQILDRAGPLPAAAAEHGEPLRAARVYVAPADCHVLVDDGRLRLWPGPRENGHRPAADPLFRSVAGAYGPAAIGVVLSGTRDDGTSGLSRIKQRGGHALVQDPEEALYAGMPASAIAHVDVDEVLGVEALAARLVDLAGTKAEPAIQQDDPNDAPGPGEVLRGLVEATARRRL